MSIPYLQTMAHPISARFLCIIGLLIFSTAQAELSGHKIKQLCQNGQTDEALEMTRRLIKEVEEPLTLAWLPSEPEVLPMLRSPQWPAVQASYFSRLDRELLIKENDYRYELQCRSAKDQWARYYHTANSESPFPAEMDEDNTRYLRELIRKQGWPRQSQAGQLAAQSAWILLQHSPDLEFQKEVLPLIERLVGEGEARRADYALLYDRVQVRQDKPQLYGSQLRKTDGRWGPILPLQEPENLDSLRAEVGLPSMDEYLDFIRRMNDPPKPGWFM